ncbi:MAG TPA: Crp/Fnr family transcriptional regulator [Edaphobacter sp.]|nr:Crp/Fnr family transcriptional regulator [Edaphobacter sp.]
MPHVKYANTLLQSFDSELIDRLHLKSVAFKVGQEIEFPGKPIKHLFFLEEGMASMTTTFKNGREVEVGMFGYESVIGVSALMGTKQSLNRIYTQIAGWGYRCRFEAAAAEFGRCGPFQRLALRYVQAQLVQAAQSAGCNAEHSNEQRLARWLLICSDRVHGDQFKMSQAFLSHMLGNTRPTVTLAAGRLKMEGLITYKRAEITIVDRKGLENRACECYGVIKQHLDDFAAFDTGDAK